MTRWKSGSASLQTSTESATDRLHSTQAICFLLLFAADGSLKHERKCRDMDEQELRIAELEDRADELEKLCGQLSAQLKKTEAAMLALSEQADSLAHELGELYTRISQTDKRTEQLEKAVSEMDDDLNDTIEDFNILSDEMHRRWHKLLARQEQQRWDEPRRRTERRGDEYGEDDGDEDNGGEYDD